MSAILNYTTSVAADKTVGEIQRILSQHGNIHVLTGYQNGVASNISFRVDTKHGTMSFMLPARIEQVESLLKKSRIPQRLRTREQAARVAWRIIKDWIEAQMALIQAGQVAIEEAFLPFVQDINGETLYSRLSAGGFKGLALPNPKTE